MQRLLSTEAKAFLRSGDRLKQADFHHIYEQCPENFRAELIRGTVIVSSPATYDHGEYQSILDFWLGTFAAKTPGVHVLVDGTVILDEDNEVQPDVALVLPSEAGGTSRVVNQYLVGPPELVVEVAYSSVSYDCHDKLQVYEATGVAEYLVILVKEARVEWRCRDEKEFTLLAVDEDGLLRSRKFPGLWLDPKALFERDRAKLLAALEQGLAQRDKK